MIRVGIVDGFPVVRAGLKRLLAAQDDMVLGGEAADACAALQLVRTTTLDVLVLDLDLPGRSGLDVLALLRCKAPGLAVLIFTGHSEEQYGAKLLMQGASAFLHKSCELAEIVAAIRCVAGGHRYITPSLAELLVQHMEHRSMAPHAHLSTREFQVLLKLAKGTKPSAIADQLALSVKTVSTYRTRLLTKLDLGSNSDVTYYALKHGLLD